MPKCIFVRCPHMTGKKKDFPDITLHLFPKSLSMIQTWISSAALSEEDKNIAANDILKDVNGDRYRMCSVHFDENSYYLKKKRKLLKPEAVPSLFPNDRSMSFPILRKQSQEREINCCCPCHQSKNDTVSLTREMGTQTSPEDFIYSLSEKSYGFAASFRDISKDHDYSSSSHIVHTPIMESTPSKMIVSNLIPHLEFTPIRSVFTSTTAAVLSDDEDCQNDQLLATGQSVILPKSLEFTETHHFGAHNEDLLEITAKGLEEVDRLQNMDMDIDEEMMTSIDQNTTKDESYVPDLSNISESDVSGAQDTFAGEINILMEDERRFVDERKFIVFESSLDTLLRHIRCPKKNCFEIIKSFNKVLVGSLLKVYGTCMENHEMMIWESQPKIKNFGAGNVILASAIICSGASFTTVKEMMDLLLIPFFSKATFHRYLNRFIYAAIDHCWLEEKQRLQSTLQTDCIYLVGDGQCDSPGFCAKYCTYTMMDLDTDNIIDFEIVQVTQATSSVAMEKLAFQFCLDRILNEKYDVQVLGTDRHMGIKKKMREEYSNISHQYDLWHYSKSLKKKLVEASKKANCKDLQFWIGSVINHFYWCSRHCKGDSDFFWSKWTSLLYHVRNIHVWEECGKKIECLHNTLGESDPPVQWLIKPSAPFKALEDIVTSTQLHNDVPHLVMYCRTGALETFHSSVLKYRSKPFHYRINSMEARTKLAVMSHNMNVGRCQAIVRRETSKTEEVGTKRTSLEHPRSRKKWIVRKIYEPVCHDHVLEILKTIVSVAAGKLTPAWRSKEDQMPPNIASSSRPDKEYAVSMHRSRFQLHREEFLED